jgi:glycerol-3-phosphate acyltransferase PlsY
MSDGRIVLAVVAAFLIGSIPFSFILARLVGGVDIRRVGSGNVGATNVARSLGIGQGLVALGLDAAKGVASVLLARALGGALDPGSPGPALAGVAAILGHNFTPFLRFRGGKGVATGAGAFGVLAPWALLASVGVFLLATLVSRMVSLGSVLAAAALPLLVHVLHGGRGTTLAAGAVAALVIVRHRANLLRIARGTESRLGSGGRG